MRFRSQLSLLAFAAAFGLGATGALRAQAPAASPSPSPTVAATTAAATDAKANVTPPKDRAVNALVLAQYDLNKNGLLDPDERKAYDADAPLRKADRLKKYDVNHDGKIDADERIMVRLDRQRATEALKKAGPAAKADAAKPDAATKPETPAKKP